MPTFMFRKIDPELWRRVKSRAAADGLTIQGLMTWLMQLYAKRGLSPFEAIDGKYQRNEPQDTHGSVKGGRYNAPRES